jgi:hypothetical protein
MACDHQESKIWTRAGVRIAAANLLAVAAFVVLAFSPGVAAGSETIYTSYIYSSIGVLHQDPNYTSCVATSSEMMLNMTTYQADLSYLSSSNEVFQSPLRWHQDPSYAKQEEILAYARASMTMLTTSAGTDPHGWRNALNYYGWGNIHAGVYRDSSYASFDETATAVVTALARHNRPVGILARSGTHVQLVTGYVVTGTDPAISDVFTIQGAYLTDPPLTAVMRGYYVPMATWRSGISAVRFSAYTESDSRYVDGIDGHVGTAEWYGTWVIIDPVR